MSGAYCRIIDNWCVTLKGRTSVSQGSLRRCLFKAPWACASNFKFNQLAIWIPTGQLICPQMWTSIGTTGRAAAWGRHGLGPISIRVTRGNLLCDSRCRMAFAILVVLMKSCGCGKTVSWPLAPSGLANAIQRPKSSALHGVSLWRKRGNTCVLKLP